jgi:protein-tyrosine phosphatase
MIDLHTHILPDWDDGAKSWVDAVKMCRMALEDGIAGIVLTPHFHRLTKYGDDFNILNEKMNLFLDKVEGRGLAFFRGAEVFVHHEIKEESKNKKLTINGGNYLFVEFPTETIIPGVKDFIYDLMLGGIIPIISHPERNAVFAARPDLLYDLIQMGCLGQVTAMSITGSFGPEIKKTAKLFLKHNLVHVIASDAHDAERRPPKLAKSVKTAAEIVGKEKAAAMVEEIPRAILADAGIPEWGEPESPLKNRKSWAIKLPRRKPDAEL